MAGRETPWWRRARMQPRWVLMLLGTPAVFGVAALAAALWAASRGNDFHQRWPAFPELVQAEMDSVVAVVEQGLAEKLAPGAAVAIGRRDRILHVGGYGRLGWRDSDPPVSADSTMYDLASVSKAVATTTAVLLLAQDGVIALDEPVRRWLPAFDGVWKDSVTWRHLLTHTSGLAPAGRMSGRNTAQRLHALYRTRLFAPPGSQMQYSDLGFIVLWSAAQRAAGEPLPRFLERRVWRPLGMHSTAFWPGLDCERCAPTMILRSGELYRGKPADSIAQVLGVPTGHAGLFSTAHDLARFAAMVANGGELEGVRILREDLARGLARQWPGAGSRTVGWEVYCPDEERERTDPCLDPIAYGHTGWTGTSLLIDPVSGAWAVVLTNRSFNVRQPAPLDSLRLGTFARVRRAFP